MNKTDFYITLALYSVVIGLVLHSKAVIVAGVAFVGAMIVTNVVTTVFVKWYGGE